MTDKMEPIKNTIRYWGLIAPKILKFAFFFEEIRGEAKSILRGLLINLLAFLGIGSISGQPIQIIPVLYWLCLLFVGRLFIGLIYYPAKSYNDKKREANKLTFRDVEIMLYRFPKGSGYGIGLRLISDKQLNSFITEIVVKIGSVKLKDSELLDQDFQYKAQFPVLIGSGSHFEKSNGILNREDKNSSAEVSVVPIVSWDNEKAWIVLDNEQGKFLYLKADTTHRITMAIEGVLDTGGGMFKLEGCGLWCDLLFQRNRKGGGDVSLRISKRNPDYES